MTRSCRQIRAIALLSVMLFIGVLLVQPALAAPGDIRTAAGNGSTGMPAGLYLPRAVHMTPGGDVYVADTYNHRIVKILATGVTATVAGNGYGDYCGDGGPAIDACLFYPTSVFVDPAGNMFIADTMNDRIRKIDASGVISTVTGYSMPGYAGDGGPAADALLNAPTGVVVSTSGEVFIADTGNNLIRRIDGNGTISTMFSLGQPHGLALDPSGTLYVSTQNSGVYKDEVTGLVSVPSCSNARGVSVPLTDTVYMACPMENTIVRTAPGAQKVSVAGTGNAGLSGDGGAATSAMLALPWGVAADQNGGMHVADSGNNRVRVVEVSDTAPPVTTATTPGGTYIAPVTVSLMCYDGVGSGCGQTLFCVGAGCSSFAPYSAPITLSSTDVLRFYSVDNASREETVREQTYTIDPLAGWYVHSVMTGGTSNIDWYAGQHTFLAPNTYVKIGETYYLVEASASGSWSDPALFFNSAHLSNCDQITGQPLGTYPDLTNMVGQTIEHFSAWPVAPPTGWIVHAYDPSAQGRIDWYASQNAALAPGSYVFLSWTFYYVAESGPGSWNDGWGVPKAYYNYARLQQCNQSTGQPLTDGGGAPLWVDASWFAGMTMKLFRAWSDPQPPIMINNGTATTYGQTVALSLSCDTMYGACVAMRFSNDAGGWSALEPYLGLRSWTLTSGSGLKTVTVQFRYGNGTWSPSHSASIVFAEPVALSVVTSGSGVVASSPAGISCGLDCSEAFPPESVVTLTATPDAGSTFAGWSGDPDCVDGMVTMNAAKSCTATFSLIPPVSSVTLSASPVSPQLVDSPVTFTAVASGGTGSYQYKFFRRAPGATAYTMVQNYSPSNTLTWETQGAAPGTHTVRVYARNAGSTAAVEASKTLSYSLVAEQPATAVTLAPDVPSPQLVDTPVTFTAVATGGTGSYQYKFWRKAPGAAAYEMVQDYSDSDTWEWNAEGDAGTYTIRVYARNAGSTAAVETSRTLSYSLVVDPPVAGVTLTGDPHGSQTVGSTATFTAVATGGTGTYEYKFLRRAPGSTVFIMAQDYSTSNILTWDTTGYATGAYGVQVRVRSRFSPASVEKSRTIPYTLK